MGPLFGNSRDEFHLQTVGGIFVIAFEIFIHGLISIRRVDLRSDCSCGEGMRYGPFGHVHVWQHAL